MDMDNGEVSANDDWAEANGATVDSDVAPASDRDEAQAPSPSKTVTGRASGRRIEHPHLTGIFSPAVLGMLNSLYVLCDD